MSNFFSLQFCVEVSQGKLFFNPMVGSELLYTVERLERDSVLITSIQMKVQNRQKL